MHNNAQRQTREFIFRRKRAKLSYIGYI